MPEDEKPPAEAPEPSVGGIADDTQLDRLPQRELTRIERLAAGVAGTLVTAAGFWTLFLAKNNGAVAVGVGFVVGAVLLIMAVQGTPLIKLGAKDMAVELSSRQIVNRAERIAAARGPDEAKSFIEGVAAVQPGAVSDPAIRYQVSELEARSNFLKSTRVVVNGLLDELFVKAYALSGGGDESSVRFSRGEGAPKSLIIFAHYTPFQDEGYWNAEGRFREFAHRLLVIFRRNPALIVLMSDPTDMNLGSYLRDWDHEKPLEIVTEWDPAQVDESRARLKAAIESMLSPVR